MNEDLLISQGNSHRENDQPEQALSCYAQAFVLNHACAAAWNNYGNVLREMGYPERALPFLEQALALDSNHSVARFNRAVTLLQMGDYRRGWEAYESRWKFEHLDGLLPSYPQPRWTGQDLRGKTLLVIGEHGLGDCIQFCRYVMDLKKLGAKIMVQVPNALVRMLSPGEFIDQTLTFNDVPSGFDYWSPMMSLPGTLKIDLANMKSDLSYLSAHPAMVADWQKRLGKKTKLRVGFSWSGRTDTWIHRYKSVPFDTMLELISANPRYDWINLQIDCDADQEQQLQKLGVNTFPGTISDLHDTAALMSCLDVIVSVDTAVSHLGGALGRPTWIMLNHYGTDWRWLLNRNDSPWYPSVKLFRQPGMHQWQPVLSTVQKYLSLFTI